MKFNLNDFAVMYLIGIFLLFIFSSMRVFFNDDWIAYAILAVFSFGPGLYYFYFNKYEIRDAIFLSILFGFTLVPVYFIVFGIPIGYLASITLDFNVFDYVIQNANWDEWLFQLSVFGAFFSSMTLLSEVICKQLCGKPKIIQPLKGKPKPK